MSSVNHLIKEDVSLKTEDRIDMASEIYLPGEQRLMKYDYRKKKVRQLQPLPAEEIVKLQLQRETNSIMKYVGSKEGTLSTLSGKGSQQKT